MTTLKIKEIGKPAVEHKIEDQPFTLLVHQQGLRVDVPEATLQLDGRSTIDYIQKLDNKNWRFASTSPIFKALFECCFPPSNEKNFGTVRIPETVEELQESDLGIQHICGIIIMTVEAMFRANDEGKKLKVFIREIESHLHPATQRTVVGMLKMLQGDAPTDNSTNTTTDTGTTEGV